MDFKHYLNILFFGIVLMFGRAYEHGMTSDNIHYAAISKSLLSSDNPLLLSLGGELYLNKPPLFFWLNSLSISVFGNNIYGAKFVSIAATVMLMMLIFRIAHKAFDSLNAGYGAVLFFIINYIVFKNSQACRFESLMTLFIMLSLLFTYRYTVEKKTSSLLYSGLFAGLVVLTKGLIGVFVFGVEIVFLLVVLRFEIKRVFGALLLSVIVFISVFGWWYVYAFIKTDLYNTMVVKESLNRLSLSSNREFNSSPIYEYLASIATYNIIMVPFIFIGLKRHIWGMRRDKGVMLFLFFFLAYFISIHFLDSKYDRYLYPLMPFMSIAAGVGLASLVKFELKKVLFSLTFIFACFMVLYPYSTGQETYDELTKVKEFAERNSLSVCVDQNYYSEWEPKSGMIYYYGDGYTVGNCEGTGILITSKNGSCKGNILLRNRKVKACIQ